MQRKSVLGFLVLVLVFSMILWGFSIFNVDDRGHNEELVYGLEPTQPESEPTLEPTPEPTTPEPTPKEPAEPEPIEPELTEPEPTKPEPKSTLEPTAPEQTSQEPIEPEPIEPAPIQHEPEPTPEPEPTEIEPTQPTPTTQTNYSISIVNAINFFEQSTEPEAILWLDVMHRRFGIEEFANSLERFDQLLYCYPEQSHRLRLFRRIADYHNPIRAQDLKKVKSNLNLITLPALYCDRLSLPSDYAMILEEGVNQGGYQLTHVLLAWVWIQENGCELELPDGFIEDMYHANAALINTDSIVTDLELEAAAFLCLAGQRELIDDSFIELVIASQDIDGGWGDNDRRWHTTILGLLLLLHVEFPSDTYPQTLAPESL